MRIYDSWKFLSANGACLAFKSIDDGSDDDDDDNGLMAYIFSSRQICVTQTIEVKKKCNGNNRNNVRIMLSNESHRTQSPAQTDTTVTLD